MDTPFYAQGSSANCDAALHATTDKVLHVSDCNGGKRQLLDHEQRPIAQTKLGAE